MTCENLDFYFLTEVLSTVPQTCVLFGFVFFLNCNLCSFPTDDLDDVVSVLETLQSQ